MSFFSKQIDKQIASYQRELIETHYQEVENMYRQIRGWRHDYRNHIQMMKVLAANGDMDGIKAYLDELDTDLNTVDTVVKTGNTMADAILNSKISLAQSKEITVQCDAHIPVKLKMSELDLCCIIGNLFDNAIEASLQLPKEERLIRVYMDMKGTQLYISFTNFTATGKLKKVVILSVSLFTAYVPETAGRLAVLNQPVFVLLLAGIMFLVNYLAGSLSSKVYSYWGSASEAATQGNRIFSFFGFIGRHESRSADIRMYNQQKLVSVYWNKESVFGADGVFGKMARGPIGIYDSLGVGVTVIFTGFVYVFTCLKALGGAFDVGSVTQYVGAVTALVSNVFELIELNGKLKTNTEYLKKAFRFLDIPNSMYQGSLTTEKRSDRQYEVEFRNVSFKYPGTEKWALKNVSMKFKVGSRLAIVGENGSGKTTFIKLLCRLYDPQEGQILLNGIDIRKYNYRDYMDIFSVVFQDFQLLSQPLGANVAGSAEYDKDKVTKALIDAGFGERLAVMPDGLDTQLYKEFTENGVEVSGGEAQKIAIARALYKDAPFIILDEPTAALDPIAEAEIYSKFNDISGDKTAIYISHRLSSCKFCDEIAVFHDGAVIQQGTHEALLSDVNGKYYELWHAQAQYYTDFCYNTLCF